MDTRWKYFDEGWFVRRQKILLFLSNHFAFRFWFRWILRIHHDIPWDKKMERISPNSFMYRDTKDYCKADFRTHDKFSKRIYFAFRRWWLFLHAIDSFFSPLLPQINFGFDTLVYYPEAGGGTYTCDGIVGRWPASGETFATIRGGAGTTSDYTGDTSQGIYLTAGTSNNKYLKLTRFIMSFYITGIGNVANVINMVTSVYLINGTGWGALGSTAINVVKPTPAANNSLANADYNIANWNTTKLGEYTPPSNYTDGYRDMTITRTGFVFTENGTITLGCMLAWDAAGSFGGSWSSGASTGIIWHSADASGTTTDPKLTLTIFKPMTCML